MLKLDLLHKPLLPHDHLPQLLSHVPVLRVKCYLPSLFLRAKGLLQTYLKVHYLEQSVKCLQLDGQIVKSLKHF